MKKQSELLKSVVATLKKEGTEYLWMSVHLANGNNMKFKVHTDDFISGLKVSILAEQKAGQ